MAKIKHGQYLGNIRTRAYRAWDSMKQRCLNPAFIGYKHYGGRGIKIHAPWLEFENFFRDMGECPSDRSLDRIDVDGDYSPSNCRWATRQEQANNKQTTTYFEYMGEKRSLQSLAKQFCINPRVVRERVKRHGIDLHEALTRPLKKYTKKRNLG
jgi:hypothetical protein